MRSYAKMDKNNKRNPHITGVPIRHADVLFKKLVQQKFRCHYTGIRFSMDRDHWRHFSLGRLDNSLNHTRKRNSIYLSHVQSPCVEYE